MSRIFITDFDGTLCQNEFYQLVRNKLVPMDTPDFWQQFVNGETSHLNVLQAYFSSIRSTEEQVLDLLNEMELEPRFGELASKLLTNGWEIIVASAGCSWYIEKLLNPFGLPLTIHSNPGRWVGGEVGLVMEAPTNSKFHDPDHGIDKAAIVVDAQCRADLVVFAGDGQTDVAGMLHLPENCRFARRDCAAELDRRGQPYRPFDRWAEVAEQLLEGDS